MKCANSQWNRDVEQKPETEKSPQKLRHERNVNVQKVAVT